MDREKLDNMFEFLDKETPTYGGCMVCQTFNHNGKQDLLLVERRKFATGDGFTINMRFWHDYDFLWDVEKPWEILWKYDGGK